VCHNNESAIFILQKFVQYFLHFFFVFSVESSGSLVKNQNPGFTVVASDGAGNRKTLSLSPT